MRRINQIYKKALVGCVLVGSAAIGVAQTTPDQAGISAANERLRINEARARTLPYTKGDGAFPAIMEQVPSLPDHVLYRPADLSRIGAHKLPIVVWGNGGCQADGAGQRLHLAEIASHGYLVIANGTIESGPGASPQPKPALPPHPGTMPASPTHAAQLTQAISWAIAQNDTAGSPLHGKLDPNAVGVSGWSCGGVQALTIATSDPRIKAVVIHDSGLFTGRAPGPEMDLPKAALARLHTPILYVLGGPTDIAYANGMDDYARIDRVPAAVVNLHDAGHGGTFFEPNGGKAAQIAIAWLDWQLKADAAARRMFVGAGCALCGDPAVTLQSKRLQ
jgi:dienelactone hydrolase